MSTVNFNQILCKSISGKAENISGIFDTLVCEKGTNSIYIFVLSSQILEHTNDRFSKYYYRMVLRQLGPALEDMKNYRVDSGVFWNSTTDENDIESHENKKKHKTTRPGSSEKLVIEYEHNFEIQGHYELDLYVKELTADDTLESCDNLRIKDLKLVSICPFNVIFVN